MEIELPDGTIAEFPDGTPQEVIRSALQKRFGAPQVASQAAPEPSNTASGVAGQFGAGSQSGIANAAGFPVDAVTGAINGIGGLTGLFPPIQNPVGGSESIDALLKPFRTGIAAPRTGAERAARRIGEDVGASATMLPLAFASPAVRAAPVAASAVEGAAALGSGGGAALANELAPDSAIADIVGSLGGGLTAGTLASRLAGTQGAKAVVRPGIEDQRLVAADAYGAVRGDPRVLPQDSVDDMALGLSARMNQERLNQRLQPGSANILDAILQDSSGPMRIEDVENLRRMTQRSIPVTATPDDKRLSGILTREITDYLDSLDDPVADALREGRGAHRRASAAQTVTDATSKAVRRAESTGSGGNEINAMRQNLRALLDSPRKARSFKPNEIEMLGDVVGGTAGQNAMRRLSRFAPSSGGLSSMLNIGGALAAPQFAVPLMAVTEGAKALGERSTRKSIEKLLQSLAPDKTLKASEPGINGIIAAMVAGRAASRDR